MFELFLNFLSDLTSLLNSFLSTNYSLGLNLFSEINTFLSNICLQSFLTKDLILLILRNAKSVFILSIDLFFKSLLSMRFK